MTGDRRDELAAIHYDNIRSYTVILSLKFNSYASLAILFIISISLCFVFEHETSYTTRMLAVWFYYRTQACNQTERKKLHNSLCPFQISRYNNIDYGGWHAYKPLFGSSVAIFWLACSDISLSMNEKKLEGSPGNGRHSTIWQTAWWL